MKKIYLACLSTMLLFSACKKEIEQNLSKATPSTKGIVTNSSIKGVSLLKDGFPYPNISASNSLAGDEIGWFLNLATIQSNFTTSSSTLSEQKNSLSGSFCGGIKSATLYAGQNIAMGTLLYANDATNLYIEYTVDPDWYMSEVHLYVGTLASAPKSGGGTPSPGRFPIKSSFNLSNLSQTTSYTIPLSSISGTIIIAAHASVLRVDTDGDVIAKETAWAAGTRFTSNKNWATYVSTSIETCGDGGGGGPVGDFTSNQSIN